MGWLRQFSTVVCDPLLTCQNYECVIRIPSSGPASRHSFGANRMKEGVCGHDWKSLPGGHGCGPKDVTVTMQGVYLHGEVGMTGRGLASHFWLPGRTHMHGLPPLSFCPHYAAVHGELDQEQIDTLLVWEGH
eukprot:1156961-Pelagomonas_calceolata.AAC.13